MKRRILRMLAALLLTAALLVPAGCGAPSAGGGFSAGGTGVVYLDIPFPPYIDASEVPREVERREQHLAIFQAAAHAAGYSLEFRYLEGLEGLAEEERLEAARLALEEGAVVLGREDLYALLHGEGRLADIREPAGQDAPEFFGCMQALLDGDNRPAAAAQDCLPLAMKSPMSMASDAYGVIVRADALEAYGSAITKWSEYVDFLRFAKSNFLDSIPGVIPTDDTMGGKYPSQTAALPIFDLPMMERGYMPTLGLAIYRTPEGELCPGEDIPAFRDVVDSLFALQEEGLVTFSSQAQGAPPMDECLSILLYPGNYFLGGVITIAEQNGVEYRYPMHDALPQDYTLQVLYDGIAPLRMQERLRCAYVGEAGDPALFLAFLEAVHTDEALYRALRLGVEGEEYEIDGAGVIRHLPQEPYYLTYNFIQALHMENEAFESALLFQDAPHNMMEALMASRGISDGGFTQRYMDAYADLIYTEDETLHLEIYQFSQRGADLMERALGFHIAQGRPFPADVSLGSYFVDVSGSLEVLRERLE